jgi:hypothetical protein
MRYWAYLIGKLVAAAAVVYCLQIAVAYYFPPEKLFGEMRTPFLWDMAYTFCVLAIWLIGAGLLALVIRDQRRRCRTCLRKLIMPVATGSWGNFLTLGRPRTEWICPFGHGTLRIEELQITGKEGPDWEPHGDNIWKELESYYQTRK